MTAPVDDVSAVWAECDRFVLLVEHDDVTTDPAPHEWVDLGESYTLGVDNDYELALSAAGTFDGDAYAWRVMLCNNVTCAGRAAYRVDTVVDAAARWWELTRRGLR